MAVEWRANEAGLRELVAAPGAVRAMEFVGGVVKDEAERIAPVRTGAYAFGVDPPTGEHGGGFRVEPFERDGAAAARVVNGVRAAPSAKYAEGFPYSVALEFGTRNMAAQHILSRALDAISLF